MKATLLLRDRQVLASEDAVVEIVIWQLRRMPPVSRHRFKYRLALVVSVECVLRYDNEAGNGDHKHVGGREVRYGFADLDRLLQNFRVDVEARRAKR